MDTENPKTSSTSLLQQTMKNLEEEVETRGFEYECGDCAKKVYLKPQDPVRCQDCGHRILYKPRTRRVIQYEAR